MEEKKVEQKKVEEKKVETKVEEKKAEAKVETKVEKKEEKVIFHPLGGLGCALNFEFWVARSYSSFFIKAPLSIYVLCIFCLILQPPSL